MNLNYVGSLAERKRKMKFRSTTEVVVNNRNELFNAVSIYIPSRFADANIVDWEPEFVTAERPAVFTCVVDNYAKIMKGALLDQWTTVFRQDTNADIIIYLIVFDDGVPSGWNIDEYSISYEPLSKAFNALFNLSFFKVLFDPYYDGRAVDEPIVGRKASMLTRFTNTTGAAITVPAGTYVNNDGNKDFAYTAEEPVTLEAGEHIDINVFATTVGYDPILQDGGEHPFTNIAEGITPALPAGITAIGRSSINGVDPDPSPAPYPSQYFDLSLALAYLCKTNTALSWMWSLVKISYVDRAPNPADKCWIRYKSRAEQLERMTSIEDNDREHYYWAALYLMACQNTTVLVHSEPVNIIVEILAAWYAKRNDSGQYVGNKLSLLRLSGSRIKPLGFPSWLDSSVNENDNDGFDQLDSMNVGYLCTIADNTPQESCLSMARGVGDVDKGLPVIMQMIAKFVDYQCSQDAAKMVTAEGTLTSPVLTDEQTYKNIQALVVNTLGLFSTTNGRIYNITLVFPNFDVAKVGRTAISAASAWKGHYEDDLDSVEVSGGLVAE